MTENGFYVIYALGARRWWALLLVALAACASPATTRDAAPRTEEVAPRFAAGGPDAEVYGSANGYPIGDRSTFYDIPVLVGSHSHLDEVFEARLIHKPPTPSRLVRVAEPAIAWKFQGLDLTLDDYLARNPATGLLIARGDTVFVERYQYGRTDRHRFTSWSMAKTVTAMLIGIAIAEGRIRSVDDLAAAYVPALSGTEYGRTSLRHLLQMSSGVRFTENYSGSDDVMRLVFDTYLLQGAGGVGAVTSFNDRERPAGTKFSYASVETQVLGLVLRAVVGRPVAAYLEEKIWQPIGAESDATWLIDNSGQEATFCCLNAVLRDYARLGLLLAHDGNWRGRQIIPAAWIMEATTVREDQPHLRPGRATRFWGYGYQTWIYPYPFSDERRMFAFQGVRGQAISVDPRSRLVMVHTAVRKQSVDPGIREANEFWDAVVRQLRG
ncbi:MAG: serine hydrolase [Candidatus Rokubacteria bacterium]|nr:serine hydrolase [Candidatus Rokubacteria bacterium]